MDDPHVITPGETKIDVPAIGELEVATMPIGVYDVSKGGSQRMKIVAVYIDDGIFWVDVERP